MAKTLKDFLNERQLGPMVVKNPDEQKFIDKHVVAKTADRNGNDDELFKGSKVKMADRPKHRKGYNPGQDEEVYEALKGAQHKIDANKNGKVDAHDFHLLRKKKKVAEEAEELEELSKGTLGSYIKKASDNKAYHDRAAGRGIASDGDADEIEAHLDKSDNRKTGINKAVKKLTKEEAEELEELSTDTLRNYRAKAKADAYDAADVDDDRRLRKRSMGSWDAGKKILKRGDALRKEEAEELDELSKATMGSYIKKAIPDAEHKEYWGKQDRPTKGQREYLKSAKNRRRGINKAIDKLTKEEAEQIDELSKKTLGSYVVKSLAPGSEKSVSNLASKGGYKLGQAHDDDYTAGEKEDAKSVKRSLGVLTAVRKMTKEDAEQVNEKDAPHVKDYGPYGGRASSAKEKMIADFNKPKNKNEKPNRYTKESRAMAVASKLTTQYGSAPLNKEERLLTKLADISETHKRTMVSVFEKLNEDNQYAFMQACDTAEGIEQMLDFSISYRGE